MVIQAEVVLIAAPVIVGTDFCRQKSFSDEIEYLVARFVALP